MSCAKELAAAIEGHGASLRVRDGSLHIARSGQLPSYLVEAAHDAEADLVEVLQERERNRQAERARRDREAAAAKRNSEMQLLPGGERIGGPTGIKDVFR